MLPSGKASYFNPRTRMGCDPASDFFRLPPFDFNPRTRMGCDPTEEVGSSFVTYFNPRTRMGCDRKAFCNSSDVFIISIHAPAWGATILCIVQHITDKPFQSTHPHGVRLDVHGEILPCILFQSTHPHGVRPRVLSGVRRNQNFNPRTRMGCDILTHQEYKTERLISIHAPAWGATPGGYP